MRKNNKTILEFTGFVKRNIDIDSVFNVGDEVKIKKVTRSGGWDYLVTVCEKYSPVKRYSSLEDLKMDIEPNYYKDSEVVFNLEIHQCLNKDNIKMIINAIKDDELKSQRTKNLVLECLKTFNDKALIIDQIVRDYEVQRLLQRKIYKGY